MLRNEVTLVDIYDNEIETCSKDLAHKEGKLHRAFSVFLINGNKMLLQKRAATKYHTPSLWTNACCSHPKLRENVVLSAEKRTFEELGINVKLNEVYSFMYFYKFKEDLIEYEYDHVMLGNFEGEVTLDPEETSEVKWVEFETLAQWMKNSPKEFTPWFLICCPEILKRIKNKK